MPDTLRDSWSWLQRRQGPFCWQPAPAESDAGVLLTAVRSACPLPLVGQRNPPARRPHPPLPEILPLLYSRTDPVYDARHAYPEYLQKRVDICQLSEFQADVCAWSAAWVKPPRS